MKKSVKIALYSVGGLLALVLIAIVVAVWFIFTPAKLTPTVQDILDKNLKCESSIKDVELTFFSTFPVFKIQANEVIFIKHIEEAENDTLLSTKTLQASVNPIRLFFDNELILTDIAINKGVVNLFTNSKGEQNFDIFPTDSIKQPDTTEFNLPFDYINLDKLNLNNIRATYSDYASGIKGSIDNIELEVLGRLLNDLDGEVEISLFAENIDLAMDSSQLQIKTPRISFSTNGYKLKEKATGQLSFFINQLFIGKGAETITYNNALKGKFPFEADIDKMLISLKKGSHIYREEIGGINYIDVLYIDGSIAKPNEPISLDLNVKLESEDIAKFIMLLPSSIESTLEDMKIDGNMSISAKIKGDITDKSLPHILSHIEIHDGKYSQKGLPISFKDINGAIEADMNLTEGKNSSLSLKEISLKTGTSEAIVNGSIDDLMGEMLCSLNIKGDLNFADFKGFMPDSMSLKGAGQTDLNMAFTVDDIKNFNLKKIKADGSILARNIDFNLQDSMLLSMPKANIRLNLPSTNKRNKHFAELIEVDLSQASRADFNMVGTLQAGLTLPKMNIGLSDISDTKVPLQVRCGYNLGSLEVKMDTIKASIDNPRGDFYMTPNTADKNLSSFFIALSSPAINADYGKNITINTKAIDLNGSITLNSEADNFISQFSPNLDAKVNSLNINTGLTKTTPKVPVIDFSLTPEKLKINQSRIVLEKSDFNLSGIVTNIEEYLKNENVLVANLNLTSDMVNVNELMDLASGFGAKDSTEKAILEEKPTDGEKDPFMVPWNVDLLLNTNVSHGKVAETDIYDLGGKLMIKDGVLVLEQMGFTCEAAKMQLTAMYRSERKNHLFAGIDFHLLDIEIDKLIDMVPQIDTIVPMLKYFKGKGEFHLAAETYLKSNYDIKYSTLRGASSIEGKNLVLLDSETFDKLSKILLFKKKTENIVDSLSVELTVFRDEVELFPFLLAMDKYQVVLQGMYNLSNNYKINAETISPIKIGVDLKSSPKGGLKLDKLKLLNLKYGNLFKPEKRNATQQQIMELKKMISDALKSNVKE